MRLSSRPWSQQQTHDLQSTESGSGVSVDERRAQLKTLIAQKQELEALYTPDYPDVVAIYAQDRRSAGGDRACLLLLRRR